MAGNQGSCCRTGVGMSAPGAVPVRVNKAVKHHVCYVEHSQPTNMGTPTKDQNRSKETLNNIGKIDFNLFI